ncbi:MAG: response regulator [Thermodesulfobacteriota bacterium]
MIRSKKPKRSLLIPPPAVKVLLAEDNDKLRNLYSGYLTKNGFYVKTASNGEEALKIILDFKPRVIILDIFMPGMNGLVLLKLLKRTPGLKRIPVIMLTGSDELLPYCFDNGVKGYVYKGSNTSKELLSKIFHLVS